MLRPMLKLTQWGHWVCELWTWPGQHWPGSSVLTCWCSQNMALQFLVCLDLVLGNAGSEQGFEHRPAFVCFHLFCLWGGESGAVLTHQSWFFTLLRNGMCGLWEFSLWSVDLYACQIESKILETSLLIYETDADSSFDILPAVTAVNQCWHCWVSFIA